MELDEKAMRKEKTSIETWGVLLGLPLWIALSVTFYFSGMYLTMSSWPLIEFAGEDPNVLFIFLTFPVSVAFATASFIRAVRLTALSHSTRPIKTSIAESMDFALWMNLTSICVGLILHYTFFPVYQSVPILGLAVATVVAFLLPIVGVPAILDFLMPRFWRMLFGFNYGHFQGKLLKNLRRSWRKGELQRDFRKQLMGALVIFVGISVLVLVLALLGFLK